MQTIRAEIMLLETQRVRLQQSRALVLKEMTRGTSLARLQLAPSVMIARHLRKIDGAPSCNLIGYLIPIASLDYKHHD